MPATKYTKSIATDFSSHLDTSNLKDEIAASSIATALGRIDTAGDDCDIWFVDALSGADQTTLDTVASDHALKAAKAAKIAAIDGRTDELISAGFTYASKQFSLALTAQMKLTGTHQVKDDPALTYPITWNTIDDTDEYDIANATDLDGFYLTALGTVRAHLDSGTTLKDSVRAAATIAAVDAVVDNR